MSLATLSRNGTFGKLRNIRPALWRLLETTHGTTSVGIILHAFLFFLILANILAVVLGSVRDIFLAYYPYFIYFEVFSVAIFTVEYALRLWSAIEDSRYQNSALVGRLRWAMTPLALIDLISFLPFYLLFFSADLRILRIFRLLLLVRVFKLGRYVTGHRLVFKVLRNNIKPLAVVWVFMLIFLVLSSSLMFLLEHEQQPGTFSSIPAAMWWAIITLTTVGYGDIYPATTGGKIVASIVAMFGVAFFALPSAIIGAGFFKELTSRHGTPHDVCPHCHRSISEQHNE